MKEKRGKMMRLVVLACVSMAFHFPLFTFYSLHAQRDDFLSRSELLLMGGGMNYIGDLNKQSALTVPCFAGGIGLRYRLDNRWAFRGEVSYGSIACEKDYLKLRNLSFKSNMLELAALAEFNFAPFGPGATERLWAPYLFGGVAVFHFNPMARYVTSDGKVRWAELQPLCTEGQGTSQYRDRKMYQLTQLSLPFGVGIKVRMGKSFSLSAEYGFRVTWTDYLDDVSKTYVGTDFLMSNSADGALAAQLADRSGEVQPGYVNAVGIKRGDDSLNDWYAYFHLSLGISFDVLLGWMRSKRCRK